MKIKSLQLKNFKRFTDLTLQDIPDNAKLVLLIGSNGSGKSSVFDAFESINKFNLQDGGKGNRIKKEYYSKDKTKGFEIYFTTNNSQNTQIVTDKTSNINLEENSFYGRSAVRYSPRIERTSIGTPIDVKEDSDRPMYYIDKDNRFENDIDLLLTDVVKKVFGDLNNRTEGKIDEVKQFMKKLNGALANIFTSSNFTQLQLVNFETPSDGNPAQLLFKKGDVEINYDLLSSGEKEIINLLINLYTRKKYFTDTVYFFDEIDSHLNTKLQYTLLKEIIENWIPENCQLWTASHSLGFIEYAKEFDKACILDFDDLNFDKTQIITPSKKDNTEIFEIVVSKRFIDNFIQDRKIIFSENLNTYFYNDVNLKNTFFFVAIDKMDVFQKAKNLKQLGLMDRDYLSDEEVKNMQNQYPFLYFLPYYSFENILYHPDNFAEYYNDINKPYIKEDYINEITKIKNIQRDYIGAGINQARSGYPFYKENENIKLLKAFKENYKAIIDLLRSDDFETFYKVFPMKEYATQLKERQNISKSELAKTNWFKTQIENIIK